MPYDPAFPATDALLISSEFRAQFTGIVDLIQTIPVGPVGPIGPAGASVNAALIDGVTTGNPGDSATATVGLSAETLHFSFSIPRGEVGLQGLTGNTGADGGIGATGATGPAFTSFGIQSVTSLDPALPATVSVAFDGSTVRFAFGIPRGLDGAVGPQGNTGIGEVGPTGAMGPAFTSFVIDGVTTLESFQPATVSASFDGSSVRLAFGIPRGAQGNDGSQGPTGPQGNPGEVTMAELTAAIAGSSGNSNGVGGLSGPFADPDSEALRLKLNELILALRR